MSKKVLIIAVGVTLSGADLAVGDTIQLDEANAASLIESGHAEAVEGEESANEDPNAGKDPAGEPGSDPNELTEEQKQAKALDAQYKRDDLYAAAKEVGVDVAYDVKKPDLIAAVIAQGFAAALIK